MEKGKNIRRLEGENSRLFKTKVENGLGTTRDKPVFLPPRHFRSASAGALRSGVRGSTLKSKCTVKQKFLHAS